MKRSIPTKFLKVTAEEAWLMSPYELDGRVADELLAHQAKTLHPKRLQPKKHKKAKGRIASNT